MAASLQPGVRVVDVARRHGLAAHQLSDWRRQARLGDLVLPADAMTGAASDALPAFVSISVGSDDAGLSADTDRHSDFITIEIGNDFVLQVPGDVPAERATAVACALRGLA